MPNYKPTSHNIIEAGGLEIKVDDRYNIFMLHDWTANNASPDSMQKFLPTAADYVVPTDHAFRCLKLSILSGASGAAQLRIFEGATADAITELKLDITAIQNQTAVWIHLATNFDIDEGKYFVVDPSGTNISVVLAIGYEIPV